jgi:hypothetical protein
MRKQAVPLQELWNSKLTSRCCRRIATLAQNLSSFEHFVYSFDPGVGKAFRSSGVCNWAILVANQTWAVSNILFTLLTLELERLSDPQVFAIEPSLLQTKACPRRLFPLAAEIWHSWNNVSRSNHSRSKPDLCSRGDLVYLKPLWQHIWLWWSPLLFDQQPWRWCGCAKNIALAEDGWNLCRMGRQKEPSGCALARLTVAVTFAKGQQKITTLTPWSFGSVQKGIMSLEPLVWQETYSSSKISMFERCPTSKALRLRHMYLANI